MSFAPTHAFPAKTALKTHSFVFETGKPQSITHGMEAHAGIVPPLRHEALAQLGFSLTISLFRQVRFLLWK